MTVRPLTPAVQVHRGRWIWMYRIPWLPDLLANPSTTSLTGAPITEAFGRQIAFLRAFAAGAPASSALQVRYIGDPGREQIECAVVGAADSREDADLLARVVATTLPRELPIEAVAADEVSSLLRAVDPDGLTTGAVVEIRRATARLDPTQDRADGGDAVLLPWTWSPQALLTSLELLLQQPARTALVVHIQPDCLPGEVASFLQDEIDRIIDDSRNAEEQPLAAGVVGSYRRWLRLLPSDCLNLRVMLVGEGELVPGVAESLSTDLTRSFEQGGDPSFGAAETVSPENGAELDACAVLLDELRAVAWRVPRERMLARLLHTFDPLEANTAFRFPVSPRGGLPGIAAQRVTSLARGVDTRLAGGRAVELGTQPSGARYSLTERDLNQHVLVAGLPGFGKTSTVQLLLERCVKVLGLPFLVIDPAKGDYDALFGRLAAEKVDVGVYRPGLDRAAFNPLALPEGVDAGVHCGRLVAAFDTAFNLSEVNPLALVYLQRAVRRVYETAEAGGRNPTMVDLYRTVGDVIRHSPFEAKERGNLEGTLLGRIEVLASVSAGRALMGGPEDGIPWEQVMSRPTLIELGAFAGPAERALIFGLLFAQLVSYREAHPNRTAGSDGTGLVHLSVLEEAHRLLRRSVHRDAGVELFVDAIAELRGAGEGFIIVDQTPAALHPSVLKLTGTKLAHRLTDTEERGAVGASMVLDRDQLTDLARLAPKRLISYAATGATAALVVVDDLPQVDEAQRRSVQRSPAFVADPQEQAFPCVACPVMCRGAHGAGVAGFLAQELRGRSRVDPGDLFTAARDLLGRPDPAAAYCGSAHAAATVYGRHPLMLDQLLHGLRSAYATDRRRMKPTASAGVR